MSLISESVELSGPEEVMLLGNYSWPWLYCHRRPHYSGWSNGTTQIQKGELWHRILTGWLWYNVSLMTEVSSITTKGHCGQNTHSHSRPFDENRWSMLNSNTAFITCYDEASDSAEDIHKKKSRAYNHFPRFQKKLYLLNNTVKVTSTHYKHIHIIAPIC